MKRVFLFFFTFIFLNTLSQAQDIDALEKRLQNPGLSKKERIAVLNLLSRNLSFIQSKRALDLGNEALELATETQNDAEIAYAYRNLASIHSQYGSFSKSLEYLQQARDYFELLNDSIGIANCNISFGHFYRKLGDRVNEINYHRQAYEIFKKIGIAERIGVTAHNLGESYLLAGELNKAISLTQFAIRVNDSIGAKQVLSACYKVMGQALQKQNKLDSALTYFNRVLAISDQLGSQSQKSATVAAYIHLSELYALQKKPELQLQKLEEAAEFAKQNQLEEAVEQIYNGLILYHAQANHSKEVIKYIQEYKAISDSLQVKQLADRIELTNSTIKGHLLAKEKKALELVSEKQFKELKFRNFIIVAFLIVAVLLLWLISKLISANRKFNIVNQQLVEQAKFIEQQNNKLEELNATKDKFFSIVAHDLKSPLNSLRTFSKMLVTDIHALDKEDITKLGAELNKSVDNTLILADNIITWARVQMKEQEWHAALVPVCEIVENVCQVYAAVADKKGINFICQVDKSLKVFGDKDQFTFIIRNLINNAVKFTATGSWVRLTVSALSNGFVEFEIADGGIGIPPEVRKNLFKLDKKKGVTGTAGEKGTGLGLILSYEFLKLNNGKLEVNSEVGKGSVFKVTFPANQKISE